MKAKAVLMAVFLIFAGFVCRGNNDVPVAISPGMAAGVGVVESPCPAFSWSGVAWAQKYRVVVFGVEADGKKLNDGMALTAKPVLSEDIAGGGLSWTPSASQGLAEGFDYVWFIGAMNADGAWAWSESRRFRVETNSKLAINKEEQTVLTQKKVKDSASSGKSLRAESGLSEAKIKGKESPANTPDGPMGSEGINTLYGYLAGNAITSGYSDTFLGRGAGSVITTGYANTFVGENAGSYNILGNFNAFFGASAGLYNIGSSNAFFGYEAGYDSGSGYENTYIGDFAGHNNSTGHSNVFIGYRVGYDNSMNNTLLIDNSWTMTPLIYGDFSTNIVGINGWLGVGTQAPAYPMEVKTTGRNAAMVANRTDGAINFVNATTSYGQFGTVNNFAVRILANAVWRLTLNTDNSLAMASGATCTAGGVWTNASSIALKENITSLGGDEAISTLQSLNPVKYNYKADASEKYVGFIAEQVPELVAMNDRKSLSPMDIVAVLTKVVQEQQKLNQEQQQFIKKQQRINEKMKREIAELKKKRSK
jgi:hypothetical protein